MSGGEMGVGRWAWCRPTEDLGNSSRQEDKWLHLIPGHRGPDSDARGMGAEVSGRQPANPAIQVNLTGQVRVRGAGRGRGGGGGAGRAGEVVSVQCP